MKTKVEYSLLKIVIAAVLLSIISNGMAKETDTLNLAKDLNAQHKYKKSCKLLTSFYSYHGDELYAGWLYADVLHKTQKFKKSQEVYFRTVQLFPENNDLKLDFAIKLAEAGEFEKALYQLNTLSDTLPKDYVFAVEKTLAKIYLWQGDYDKSLVKINQALALYNNEPEAIDLKNQIDLARSNWLIIDVNYFEDDQPLKTITPKLETIIYKNSKISGGINLNSPVFLQGDEILSSQWLNAMLQYQFLPAKIRLKLNAGFIKFPSNDYDWTAAIQLYKKLIKHLELGLIAERKPYLSTEAAIGEKVMQTTFSFFLSWNNPKGWMGNASFDLNLFPAYDNQYYTASAWIVSPALKLSVFSFRLGYGFNYSDSEESNYVSKDPLDKIQGNWNSTTEIEGVYDPFFSPNEQTIHSAILMFSIKPTKKIDISLKTNYGFMATAKTPYLFLNKKNNGKVFMDRGFFDDSYHPVQFTGNISYDISSTFSLNGYYIYQSTNFYVGQSFGLTTIIHF